MKRFVSFLISSFRSLAILVLNWNKIELNNYLILCRVIYIQYYAQNIQIMIDLRIFLHNCRCWFIQSWYLIILPFIVVLYVDEYVINFSLRMFNDLKTTKELIQYAILSFKGITYTRRKYIIILIVFLFWLKSRNNGGSNRVVCQFSKFV